MRTFYRALATAAVVGLSGGAASAATFNLADQYRAPASSFSMTDDGITMTVSGSSTVRTHQGYGLSVGYHMIDGAEYAIFAFSEAVRLVSFYAGYTDRDDNYRIFANLGGWTEIQSGNFGVSNYADGGNNNRATVSTTGGAASTIATMFAIATGDCSSSSAQTRSRTYCRYNDDFKIRDIVVEGVSEVPLPASGLLLLGALGALGLRRRKA